MLLWEFNHDFIFSSHINTTGFIVVWHESIQHIIFKILEKLKKLRQEEGSNETVQNEFNFCKTLYLISSYDHARSYYRNRDVHVGHTFRQPPSDCCVTSIRLIEKRPAISIHHPLPQAISPYQAGSRSSKCESDSRHPYPAFSPGSRLYHWEGITLFTYEKRFQALQIYEDTHSMAERMV